MNDPKRILLIEDEESLRFLYDRQFRKANFNITSVATGDEGEKMMEENTYDMVLLDLMLPDTNGINVLRRLDAKKMLHKSPVILLTNLADESIMQEGHRLGIVGYIIKAQYTPDQIVEQVRDYLIKPEV